MNIMKLREIWQLGLSHPLFVLCKLKNNNMMHYIQHISLIYEFENNFKFKAHLRYFKIFTKLQETKPAFKICMRNNNCAFKKGAISTYVRLLLLLLY